jgi:hypothetical protein
VQHVLGLDLCQDLIVTATAGTSCVVHLQSDGTCCLLRFSSKLDLCFIPAQIDAVTHLGRCVAAGGGTQPPNLGAEGGVC